MKYCPSCGGEINDNMNNCPNCGAIVNGTYTNENPAKVSTTDIGVKPVERDIVVAVILSLVTCGFYCFYWMYCLTEDSNKCCRENVTASGGLAIVYTLITCGVYGYYWMYKQGKKLNEAGNLRGIAIEDNAILYLVLSFVGLGIVNYCLMQDSLNKLAK